MAFPLQWRHQERYAAVDYPAVVDQTCLTLYECPRCVANNGFSLHSSIHWWINGCMACWCWSAMITLYKLSFLASNSSNENSEKRVWCFSQLTKLRTNCPTGRIYSWGTCADALATPRYSQTATTLTIMILYGATQLLLWVGFRYTTVIAAQLLLLLLLMLPQLYVRDFPIGALNFQSFQYSFRSILRISMFSI